MEIVHRGCDVQPISDVKIEQKTKKDDLGAQMAEKIDLKNDVDGVPCHLGKRSGMEMEMDPTSPPAWHYATSGSPSSVTPMGGSPDTT